MANKKIQKESSEDAKADRFLEKRLSHFGLDKKGVELEDLDVPDGQTYLLSMREPKDKSVKHIERRYHKLKPQSWPELKQWIGIPDQIARQRIAAPLRPVRGVAATSTTKTMDKMQPETIADMLTIAKYYLLTDSTKYKVYESALTGLLETIDISILFLKDITIGHNATLVIGSDQHALNARNIYIYSGGELQINSGFLNISCFSMHGNLS